MISRIWHGWTSRQNAGAYERLLRSEIFKGIEHRESRVTAASICSRATYLRESNS